MRARTAKWLPLLAICLGTFMLLLDVTIINVALPDMVDDLGASFAELQWVIDAYALALAALLLGIGAVADRRGQRRTYLVGLVIFILASAAAGVAPDTGTLIGARAVQGIGGAAMFATTIALLHAGYEGRDRGTAFGIWAATASLAAAAGPLAGGVLTELLSWRWIFFVNIPLGLLTIVLARRSLAPDRPAAGGGRLDVPGVVTFTIAAAAVTAGLVEASEAGWGDATTLGFLALGVVGTVAFVLVEARVPRPLVDLALLRRGAFSGVLIGAVLLSATAFGSLVYASLWLQNDLGQSPIAAGLGLVALPVAAFLTSASIGRLLHGEAARRWAIAGGLACIGAGNLLQLTLDAGSGRWALIPGLLLVGVGAGLCAPVLASAALAAVPGAQSGMAAGAVNTARQLGLALGIALLGALYAAAGEGVEALREVYWVAGACAVAGALLMVALLRPAGEAAPIAQAA